MKAWQNTSVADQELPSSDSEAKDSRTMAGYQEEISKKEIKEEARGGKSSRSKWQRRGQKWEEEKERSFRCKQKEYFWEADSAG